MVGIEFTGYGIGSYFVRGDICAVLKYGLCCIGGVVGSSFLENESAKDIVLAGDGMPCDE